MTTLGIFFVLLILAPAWGWSSMLACGEMKEETKG
jgi:hypothetical protein